MLKSILFAKVLTSEIALLQIHLKFAVGDYYFKSNSLVVGLLNGLSKKRSII
jgi:hypothetical protein